MAMFSDTCPKPGDLDNTLLGKIAQSLCEGGGSGAGVSSISLNGGPPQTGAVSITTGGGGGVTSVNGDPGPAVLLDSGEVPEGANLYYTQGRFDTAFAGKTTTNLAEGLNLYFTNARAIASTLTGFVAAPGVITAADSILSAFEKVVGNAAAAGPFVLKAGDTMTGALLGADGTVALPMFSFSGDPNTGIFQTGVADSLGISTGGGARMILTNTSVSSTVQHLFANGSAAAPGVSFSSDSDTGLFATGAANTLGLSTGGVVRITLNTASASSTLPFLGPNSSAAAPTFSFSGDPDTGMYLSAANTLGFSTIGSLKLTIGQLTIVSTLPFWGPAADAVEPTYSFSTDTNTGMFLLAGDQLGFSTAGSLKLTVATALITATLPIQQSNSADLGADPTNATTQWATSGEWKYRSSAASEGAGQTNRVHNRAAEVMGAGTDYTFTTTYARVDFGTTDPEIVLPTAGTYLLIANTLFLSSALSTNDVHGAKLRNSTDSVDVGHGNNATLGVSFYGSVSLSAILTVTASKTIQLWAVNTTAARGTVVSAATSIRYVRLY